MIVASTLQPFIRFPRLFHDVFKTVFNIRVGWSDNEAENKAR